jgi:biopolymer transport protein ExbD
MAILAMRIVNIAVIASIPIFNGRCLRRSPRPLRQSTRNSEEPSGDMRRVRGRGGDCLYGTIGHLAVVDQVPHNPGGVMIFRSRVSVRSDLPTSSMADIAFLLLIFFLVTTVFIEDRGLQIVLPEPGTVDIPEESIVFFNVRADGVVELQRGNSPRKQLLRTNAIAALWRLELQQNPNLIAALRTHPDAPYRFMIDALDALKASGAERISLQTGY